MPNLVYNELDTLELKPDIFIQEMRKYNAVIAGSFMYKIFSRANFDPGDIDVYIQHFGTVDPNTQYENYHLFETFLVQTYHAQNIEKITYSFIDGIVYSRVYKTKHININVIFVDRPVVTYINDNFDLDCCKIIYDGSSVTVCCVNDLIHDISKVRYHKYDLSQIDSNIVNDTPNHRNHRVNYSIYKSMAFTKYLLFYDIYCYNKGLIKSINASIHSGTVIDNIDELTSFIPLIAKKVDLDKLFSTNPSINPLTQDAITVISMIRLLERVEKYKSRGIKQFEYVDLQ